MEQTLGNVTHYENLRAVIDRDPRVDATWYPLAFPPRTGLETLPPLRSNWSLRSSLRARRLLRRDGAAQRYDALFFHTQVTTLLSADLMRRVPSVVSLDATPLNYDRIGAAYDHRLGGGRVEALKTMLNRRAFGAARAFVPFSDWARRSLVDDYGIDAERVTVVPPGVDLSLWTDRGDAPRETGVTRLLFVGGDFERKGGDVLLQAFQSRLRGRCELHLVTSAPVAASPSEDKDIHVHRHVTPNSAVLRRLYARADLFVLPTLGDCYSHVAIEAMATGLPVVTTPVGGIPEIVQDGETGLLVPPGDARALGDALDALVGDPARRRAMGAAGRARAERLFDGPRNIRRILDIVLGAGAPGSAPDDVSSPSVVSGLARS